MATSHAKAIKPHATPVGGDAFELLEPNRSEGVPHVLTRSELADAVKANRRRRPSGRSHGVPTPRDQPDALELLEPDHYSCPALSDEP